jgi:hypothetical protein
MSIFNRDETAWSALTKAMEAIVGDPGNPLIVQAPSIFRPLSVRGVEPKLARFRQLLLGEKIPSYLKENTNDYISSGKSVALGYYQYLQQLNSAMTDRFVPAVDRETLKKLMREYLDAASARKAFTKAANADWKKKKEADPSLTRREWDDGFGDIGYTPGLRILTDEVVYTYGQYKSKQAAYPALNRVRDALYIMDNVSSQQETLPKTEDDLNFPDSWDSFYKTILDISWDDFFAADAPQKIRITQSSSLSTSYEHRWSAGGSVSYGFFSVGGSASGGNIERHFREGTQDVSFAFQKMVPAAIVRGAWYDEGLIDPYTDWVSKEEYWGRNGTLNIIPLQVVVARGLEVAITTSSVAHDAFQSWYQQSASAGFSFGPWRVGGSGGSSTSTSKVENTSSGTTVSFKDISNQVYVLSLTSKKMDDFSTSGAYFRELALSDHDRLTAWAEDWDNAHGLGQR